MRAGLFVTPLAVAGSALLALTGSGASQTGVTGRLAFSRAGNVFVCNLDGTGERQITQDGGRPWGQAGTNYGCPTFIDGDRLVFLAWDRDANSNITGRRLYTVDLEAQQPPAATKEIADPCGLGYCAKDKSLYYLKLGERLEGENTDWGADLILVRAKPDGTEQATKVHSWHGEVSIDHCRIRVSQDGRLVAVPRNATDVSSYYAFHWLDGTEDTDLEEWLGGACLNGVDLSPAGVYGIVAVPSDLELSGRGLYALNVPNRRRRLVAEVPKPVGVAVCSRERAAVVESDGTLKLVDLGSHSVRDLCQGVDPDVYPK